MSSTRLTNSKGEYACWKYRNSKAQESRLYAGQGVPGLVAHPGVGLLGAHMPPTALSSNAADIESALRGLGSTNLEAPQPEAHPQLLCLPMTHIYRPVTVMVPDPLVVEVNPRHSVYGTR